MTSPLRKESFSTKSTPHKWSCTHYSHSPVKISGEAAVHSPSLQEEVVGPPKQKEFSSYQCLTKQQPKVEFRLPPPQTTLGKSPKDVNLDKKDAERGVIW